MNLSVSEPAVWMGWVKICVGVGVGVYSYRSITRVNSLVRQVKVPSSSLLAKHSPSQAGMDTQNKGGHYLPHSNTNVTLGLLSLSDFKEILYF